MPYITITIDRFRLAGHEVTPADGVPGLWNVAGLARDVTTNQLHELAERHCAPYVVPFFPRGMIITEPGS